MSSDNQEQLTISSEDTRDTDSASDLLIQVAGAVTDQPVPQQLVTPSLPSIAQPPPLPLRSSSRPTSPGPWQLTPLPPFSPLNPLQSLLVPTLQTDPLVTPNLSPVRSSSVISCPPYCEGVQYHQVPVYPIQPELLQAAHLLGDKLVEKFRNKIQLVSTSVSSLEPDLLDEALSVSV